MICPEVFQTETDNQRNGEIDLHVGRLGEGGPGGQLGHRQEGDYAQRDPPGDRLYVHPEGDPGHRHDEDRGEIVLDEVETDGPLEVELSHQTAVVTNVDLVVALVGLHQLDQELRHSEILRHRDGIFSLII